MVIRWFLKGQPALWAVGLLLALVLSQTIGLFHGVIHGPVHATPVAQAGLERPTTTSPGGTGRLSAKLFGAHGDHSNTPECRLFDQCSHGDALAQLPALALPLVLSAYLLSFFAGLAQARWHAHFQARGPPLVC